MELGEVSGQQLVFVGVERPGMIFVYSVQEAGGVVSLNYESLFYGGGFNRTWQQLYDARETIAIDVEDMK